MWAVQEQMLDFFFGWLEDAQNTKKSTGHFKFYVYKCESDSFRLPFILAISF